METKWLKDFLALSALGNFRLAALQRNVSQPAFSRRIQALEAWLDAPLIDRSCHPSQLTVSGRLFLPVAQKIIDIAEAGKADIQTQLMEEKEKIRFSTVGTIAQIFMPVWLKNLQPLIGVDQFVVNTEYVGFSNHFSALEHNHVDFFIGYLDPRIAIRQDESLFASIIGTGMQPPKKWPPALVAAWQAERTDFMSSYLSRQFSVADQKPHGYQIWRSGL